MRPGAVALDLGGAYNAPVAEPWLAAARESDERTRSPGGGTMPTQQDRANIAQAALGYAASAPGASTYVNVRVGFRQDNEFHAAILGGRTLRLGLRHVLWHDEDNRWSMTLGGQLRGAAFAYPWGAGVSGLTMETARSLGADAVYVVGRTTSEIYDPYMAVRASYTHGYARMGHPSVDGGAPFEALAHQVDATFTVGMRVGFGRISGTAECGLGGGYTTAAGSGFSTSGAWFNVYPAAALSLAF